MSIVSVLVDPVQSKRLRGSRKFIMSGVTDTSNQTLDVDFPGSSRITQINVNRTLGSGDYSIFLYGDSGYNELVGEFQITNPSQRESARSLDIEYENEDTPTKQEKLYVKVVPDNPGPHDYTIRIFFD